MTLRSIAREAGVHPVYFAARFGVISAVRWANVCAAGSWNLHAANLPAQRSLGRNGAAGRIHRQRSPDAHLQAIHGTDAGKYRTFLRFRTAYLPAATLRLR
jgi:hypothetical protein